MPYKEHPRPQSKSILNAMQSKMSADTIKRIHHMLLAANGLFVFVLFIMQYSYGDAMLGEPLFSREMILMLFAGFSVGTVLVTISLRQHFFNAKRVATGLQHLQKHLSEKGELLEGDITPLLQTERIKHIYYSLNLVIMSLAGMIPGYGFMLVFFDMSLMPIGLALIGLGVMFQLGMYPREVTVDAFVKKVQEEGMRRG